MRAEWDEYLKLVGAKNPVINDVERTAAIAQRLSSEELESLFLTEYVTDEGERIFEHLWFFTSSCAMESKDFLSKDNCDLSVIKSNVSYLELKWSDYDFEVALSKSRLQARYQTVDGVEGDLRATRENCDHLRDIVDRYFKPNIWDPPSSRP